MNIPILPHPSLSAPYVPVITGTTEESGCPIPPRPAATEPRFMGVKIHALITNLEIHPLVDDIRPVMPTGSLAVR